MKTFFIVILFSEIAFAQVMQNPSNSLFADYKASKIGDAVTVIVMEQNSASKDASTNTSRQSTISGSGQATYGSKNLPSGSLQLGTDNEFKGSGSTSEAGTMQAVISARVVKVDEYGNLEITGSRFISVNGQDQIMKISGIIRPSDIQPDNTISSSYISDAKIIFEGSGSIDRAQSPGWLTKIFHWLF
ncbi:MAG TPA: flagellar basal body L-ring protein FlgH [Candidatus Acidoferrales bacterium]|nr:flagellar basal body L-ring protein FlgH [Candidatus Acidoferrales bacterium]